jgi:hypothetical protein
MALSLEHLKLLNPKISQLELGTGGVPDVSWHEVCDLLAKVSPDCRHFARLNYAGDPGYRVPLVEGLTRKLFLEDRKNKRPLWRSPFMWHRIIDLGVTLYLKRVQLTRRAKAAEVDVRHWKRHHEKTLQIAVNSIDELDYDLRVAIRDWNMDNESRITD